MKSAIIAALIGSAAAFAPAPVAKTTTAYQRLRGRAWCPAPSWILRSLRYALWRCYPGTFRPSSLRRDQARTYRSACLPWQQIVTRAGIHLPGNIDYSGDSFDSFPNGVAALIGPDAIPFEGQGQIIAFIGWLEIAFMRDVAREPETNTLVTSVTDTLTSDGMTLMKRPSFRSVPSSSTTAVPPMFGILGLMVHEKIVPLGYDPDLPLVGHM